MWTRRIAARKQLEDDFSLENGFAVQRRVARSVASCNALRAIRVRVSMHLHGDSIRDALHVCKALMPEPYVDVRGAPDEALQPRKTFRTRRCRRVPWHGDRPERAVSEHVGDASEGPSGPPSCPGSGPYSRLTITSSSYTPRRRGRRGHPRGAAEPQSPASRPMEMRVLIPAR